MDRFGLSLLSSPKDAANQAQSATNFMNESGQFNKKNATDFLDAIYVELTSSQTSPTSKVMTLYSQVIKEMTYLAESRFFSLLSSHNLLQFLVSEAKNIDPKKNLNEKGLKKFEKSPENGRDYMRLLLQLINFWGQKFAKGGKSGGETKYKKNLVDLKNLGVVLPSNYEIFDPNEYKLKAKKVKDSAYVTPTEDMMTKSKDFRREGKIMNELQFTKDRINIYMEQLEQAQDPEKVQSLIKGNHAFFEKQLAKYSNRQTEFTNELALIEFTSIYFILEQESKFYNEYAPINDWQSYIYNMKVQVEEAYPSGKPSLQQPKKPASNISQPPPPPPQPVASSRPNRIAESNVDSKALISNLYSRLEQKSKSPHSGFRAVQLELEKEKQLAKKNPVRRVSRSPRNLGRSGQGGLNKSTASNLRQSKIHPIFTSPPNPLLGDKFYDGDVIAQNRELTAALYSLKKEQGSRRFKISNFRQKNPLFENQQIQVGYKSQAVFEQINDFNHFIMLNIFIGNKTQEVIKQFQVEYKADNNQLLYANPRNVDSIIPAGYQNKHDLMITPLQVPYSLMTMHIRYKFKDTGYMTSIVLPNSVLKFASYMKISKSDFDSGWRTSNKFRTSPFNLCRQLAPDSFSKWIPVLQNITRYSEFSKQGSETDLQMFCLVILLQKHEALLKINIRPNLDVVLQLGVLDNNQEGLEYFKFYLETLELILKEIDV